MSSAPTPMIAQYLTLKEEAGDALLLFRMGDFYELFFEDAVKAARALDIVLTTRGEHDGKPVPMCGVPIHAYEAYMARLVRAGFTVAVAEQMEDPKTRQTKGPVRRAIVRILTAGTLTEEQLLDAGSANWLLACFPAAEHVGLAWADISTGLFHMTTVGKGQLAEEIDRIEPAEILCPRGREAEIDGHVCHPLDASLFRSRTGARLLEQRFGVATLDGFGDFDRHALAAAAGLLAYLEETACGAPFHLSPPTDGGAGHILAIDSASRKSLELLEAAGGGRRGSLFHVLDRTITAGGARQLATDLGSPLADRAAIEARLDTVAWFLDGEETRRQVRGTLRKTPDLARSVGRVMARRHGPRDLAAIRDSLLAAEEIAAMLEAGVAGGSPDTIRSHIRALVANAALFTRLRDALADTPPLKASEGGAIRAGHDHELDEYRNLASDSRTALAALEQSLRATSGIASLKVRHNNVLGYHVEVPGRYAEQLLDDPDYRHRQTLANNVRFDTVELRTLATRIVEARMKALEREEQHLAALAGEVAESAGRLSATADALAQIDRSAALAERAEEGGWTRPTLTDGDDFRIVAGRHPVVEAALDGHGKIFVPNDCCLEGDARVWLVSGPNMGGKSTFLRQNALFAILAQMGSHVPAVGATIGIVDRITCRVGASDNLAEGRSTFMVEMVETAALLNTATRRSLLLLDEVGRGTATWDGLALAWAILEYIHDEIGARALFATHYHELGELEGRLKSLALKTMRVREWEGELLFLHEVGDGAAAGSFGLQVAKLAGVPGPVLHRAREILNRLEQGDPKAGARDLLADLPLFSRKEAPAKVQTAEADRLRERLHEVEPDLLTPRAALDLLYELVALAQENRQT